MLPARGQFLWILLLHLTFRFSNALIRSHLCSKVTKGAYSSLDLKSLSYYGTHQLVLIESDQKYIIPRKDLDTHHRLHLPPPTSWNDAELGLISKKMTPLPPKSGVAVYFFTKHIPGGFFTSSHTKVSLNLLTATSDYTFDLSNTEEPKLVEKTDHRLDYSIVAEQLNDGPSGFIIQKNGPTGGFLINNLALSSDKEKLQVHLKEPSKAWSIERTEKADQMALVHTSNGNFTVNSKRQLFTELPIGFKTGSKVYLFDSERGCVYVLTNLPDEALSVMGGHQRILLKRLNIPFEDFFLCDARFYPIDEGKLSNKSRCEANVYRQEERKENDALSSLLVALMAFLPFGILACACAYLYFVKSTSQKAVLSAKKRKSECKKSEKSSLSTKKATPSRSKSTPATSAKASKASKVESSSGTPERAPTALLALLKPGSPANVPPTSVPFEERVRLTAKVLALKKTPT